MRKALLISLVAIIIVFILTIIIAIVLSFKIVRQTTDNINFALKQNFQSIVNVPTPVPPETRTFDQTTYIWEMETDAHEIVKVQFKHDTNFSKKSNQMVATLEMPSAGDPSLFDKVLPAIVTDRPTLSSLVDIHHPNVGQSPDNLYESVELTKSPINSDKVVKITWHLNRNNFVNKNENLYKKIYSYPEPIIKALYSLQRAIIEIFSGS